MLLGITLIQYSMKIDFGLFWLNMSLLLIIFTLCWSVVDLQRCVSFRCIAKWFSYLLFIHSIAAALWPHGLQHFRLSCPSLSPRVCSNSCPLSQWCHPMISCSFTPFSSCPQSFPASGSFPMSQLFASSSWSIGASASVFPVNIQDWFPL